MMGTKAKLILFFIAFPSFDYRIGADRPTDADR